ncbi:MAG: DUF6873 family GME fold protein [Oscillospiraceae bacterium]
MTEILCMPNLPKGRVRRILIGKKYAELRQPLKDLGIETMLMPDIPEVDKRLSGHVDLAALPIGGKILLGGRAGEAVRSKLENLGFATEIIPLSGGKYPLDACLNACVMGEHIIHNREISLINKSDNFINVRQGYSKCNVCPVTEHALITSDPGIAKVCTAAGLDVLKISEGHIALPGIDTGFIGGSAFKISSDCIAFTGSLARHPDCGGITEFLRNYGIKPIDLTDGPAFDIGSAVLLTEEGN